MPFRPSLLTFFSCSLRERERGAALYVSGGAKQLLARVVLIRYGVVFLGVAWKSGGGRFSNVLQIVRGVGWRDFWCPWGAFVPLSEHITLQ